VTVRRLFAVAMLLGCSGGIAPGAASAPTPEAASPPRRSVAPASGEELLARGLSKQAQGEWSDAHTLFEAARAALERDLGQRAVLEPRRGVWNVGALAWAADGSQLAVADADVIHVLAADTFREVLRLHVQQGPIAAIAFSIDQRTLAASSGSAETNARVELWDLPSAGRLAGLESGPGAVDSLVFSPNGGLLAGRRWEASSVPLWSVPRRELVRRLELVANEAEGAGLRFGVGDRSARPAMLAFSPDGGSLLGVCDERVLAWDLASSDAHAARAVDAKVLGIEDEMFHAVAYHPSGHFAVASTDSGKLVSWELGSSARLGLVKAHDFGSELAFSRDGERLLSVATDGVVRTFVAASLTPLRSQPKAFDVDAVAPRPDARAAALASAGGVLVRDAESGESTPAIRPALPITAVAVAAGMRQLALGTGAGGLALLDTATGALRWLKGHDAEVTGLAFSPDGHELASASRDRRGRVWDLASGAIRHALEHPTPLHAAAYRADGRLLATAGDDGVVRLWDTATGKRLKALGGSACALLALAFSPDGSMLAANAADHSLLRWNAVTFTPLGGVKRDRQCGGELTSWPGTLGFSSDGSLIASAPSGNEVELWNAKTGQMRGALPDLSPRGREFYVRSVTISPRDSLVIAAAGESLVAWRPSERTGVSVAASPVEVDSVVFSDDGRFLVGASRRGAVSLWRVGPAGPVSIELTLELWLELSSESSGSVRSSDGRVEWLGSEKPPAACVLGAHVYPAELCAGRSVTSGLLARALSSAPPAASR
jgi:WD40 repeat protein